MLEKHHVDNHLEAASFINSHVANSSAFVISIEKDDKEVDCTSLQGSSGFYEFRCSQVEGQVWSRKWPCACDPCMDENWDACLNVAVVGGWTLTKLRAKGERAQRSRNKSSTIMETDQANSQIETEEWEVRSIVGRKVISGNVEYLVEWYDWPECTWVPADQMDCQDLIEQWEDMQDQII